MVHVHKIGIELRIVASQGPGIIYHPRVGRIKAKQDLHTPIGFKYNQVQFKSFIAQGIEKFCL